tara:strand:- start:27 stop:719 length:693 start_codon:yes stop_codon:yes gene_type:complete
MATENTRIIHRGDLPLGGFAGIVETRMVMSPLLWKEAVNRPDISHGLGSFVYLASGHFNADDGAPMHPHKDVDIVSFIPNGAVGHEGTMGDGTVIQGPGVQVQRAGTGIRHAEFSLNGQKADLVQIWFLPPEKGLAPGYQDFTLEKGKMTTVLGGGGETFGNEMNCQIGLLEPGDTAATDRRFIGFISDGDAVANGKPVGAGDIIEGDALELVTGTGCNLVLIQYAERFN